MTKYDNISCLFWLGVAVVVCIESIRLGVGSFRDPGPGLIPLGSGLILGILAFIVFVNAVKKSWKEKEAIWKQGTQWRKILYTVSSLIAYGFLIDLLGFRLITFLWMGFLCKMVGNMGWKTTVFASVITTLACSLLFEYYLGIRFPFGILSF